jgi:hypothetical protein
MVNLFCYDLLQRKSSPLQQLKVSTSPVQVGSHTFCVKMAPCAHQQWLQLQQDKNGIILKYGNRLGVIAHSLPRPHMQYPSTVLLVGKELKARVLRALFPGNSISRCRHPGLANICVDPRTQDDEYPVLIADVTPDQAQTCVQGTTTCHEVKDFPIAWPDAEIEALDRQDVISLVHARVLSLFVDVVCIFAQDCGGMNGVAQLLTAWTSSGSASTLATALPRLLVITSISGPDFAAESLQFRLRVLSDPRFSNTYSSLNVLNLVGSPRLRPREHFSGVEMVLRDEIVTARAERTNSHTLFSMIHMADFFDLALRNFAASPRAHFNFISAARDDNPVPANFHLHLKSFMTLALKHRVPHHILWEFVASAIVLDNFILSIHCKCLNRYGPLSY